MVVPAVGAWKQNSQCRGEGGWQSQCAREIRGGGS